MGAYEQTVAPGFCTSFACRDAEAREMVQQNQEARNEARATRAAAKAGQRGPLPDHLSSRAQRKELQLNRAAAGGGTRGPMPGKGAGGRPQEEDSNRARREELQANRAAAGGGTRGPMPGARGRPREEGSSRARREELQANRAAAGAGARGPLPGKGAGGRPKKRPAAGSSEDGYRRTMSKQGVVPGQRPIGNM